MEKSIEEIVEAMAIEYFEHMGKAAEFVILGRNQYVEILAMMWSVRVRMRENLKDLGFAPRTENESVAPLEIVTSPGVVSIIPDPVIENRITVYGEHFREMGTSVMIGARVVGDYAF